MTTDSDRVRRFLALYNQLDVVLRERAAAKGDGPSHAKLLDRLATRDPVIRANLSRLHAYRALRNSLVHLQDEVSEPIAEPREDVVEDYRRIVDYVRRPPSALETIAIRENIFAVSWDMRIVDALRSMVPRSYRLAPILDEGRLVGVFLDDALTRALFQSSRLSVDSGSTFRDLQSFCALEDGCEIPGVVLVEPGCTIEGVEEIFQKSFADGIAVGVVLVTTSGRSHDPLLGLITPHDLPSASGRRRFVS